MPAFDRTDFRQATGFSDYVWQRVRSLNMPLPTRVKSVAQLGASRVALGQEPIDEPHAAHQLNPSNKLPTRQTQQLLANLAGHILTPHWYLEIKPFHENRAVVAFPNGRYGYIDTLGHEVIPDRYEYASAFSHGQAVVSTGPKKDATIDIHGRYLLAPGQQQLTGIDDDGFIRRRESSPIDSQQHLYRYLPPSGQAGFPRLTFDEARPFYQGRARVRKGTRWGLINKQGHWITPLGYDKLLTPTTWFLTPHDKECWNPLADPSAEDELVDTRIVEVQQPYAVGFAKPEFLLRPDPGYLLARRSGKWGIVERHSAREVITAMYDQLVTPPLHGTICLRRGGVDYVGALSTGTVIEGRYQGLSWIRLHERLLYLTRQHPAVWALIDTAGRLRTPWLPGVGYPTSQGLLLSHEPTGNWTLRDSTGLEIYSSRARLWQPERTLQWQSIIDQQDSKTLPDDWQLSYLPLLPIDIDAHAAFLVQDSTCHCVRQLDSRLREVSRVPLPKDGGQLLATVGCWLYLLPSAYQSGQQDVPAELPPGTQLYTDEGLRLALSSGATWAYLPSFNYARAWRQYGVLPTTMGYVTRGGGRLWKE